jgi:hypothetical protein
MKCLSTSLIIIFLFCSTLTSLGQTTIKINSKTGSGQFTRIQSSLPSTNISHSQLFTAVSGTINGVTTIDRSLLKFDLSQIPTNAEIVGATLELYANTVNGGHSTIDGSNECWLEKIAENWIESSTTWNNQPKTDTTHRVSINRTSSVSQNFVNIDVTDIIKNSFSNNTNFGFMLKLKTEANRRVMVFASANASDTTLHPILNVTYTESASLSKHNDGILKVYPNPVKDLLSVETGKSDFNSYEIISMDGQTIVSATFIPKSKFAVNIEAIPAGVYFLRLKSADKVMNKKFVVNK